MAINTYFHIRYISSKRQHKESYKLQYSRNTKRSHEEPETNLWSRVSQTDFLRSCGHVDVLTDIGYIHSILPGIIYTLDVLSLSLSTERHVANCMLRRK